MNLIEMIQAAKRNWGGGEKWAAKDALRDGIEAFSEGRDEEAARKLLKSVEFSVGVTHRDFRNIEGVIKARWGAR